MPPKKNAAKPAEAFLSHSSKNLAFASQLAKVLSAHQVKTFFSKKHIQGAQQWHDEIETALKRCDWFVVVLSPQSVASQWLKHELIYALQANRYKGRIVRSCTDLVTQTSFRGPFPVFNGSILERIFTKAVAIS